jgi:hypothetical protein
MKHFCDEWIHEWCHTNGWTDLFVERQTNYWAFPPGAVMPTPIPSSTLRLIKVEKGLSQEERVWAIAAVIVSISALFISFLLKNPMPATLAFAFVAVTVGMMEIEDI